jgi:hypothetical protein
MITNKYATDPKVIFATWAPLKTAQLIGVGLEFTSTPIN